MNEGRPCAPGCRAQESRCSLRNPVRNRSNDVDYEYHQDPNFYYLSGLREPRAMLFVFKEPRMVDGMQASRSCWWCRP